MWPVLFKLQRCSHADDAAAVRCLINKRGQNTGEEKKQPLLAARVRVRGVIKGQEAGIYPGAKTPFAPTGN